MFYEHVQSAGIIDEETYDICRKLRMMGKLDCMVKQTTCKKKEIVPNSHKEREELKPQHAQRQVLSPSVFIPFLP